MLEPYVTRASRLERLSARSIARHTALSGLSIADRLLGRHAALSRNRVQILALHHILDDEVEPFRRLLRQLARQHTFIGYGEAVARIREGRIDRPYLTFTFDDGLASCVQAAKLLDEAGAKAAFFVCPSIVGETDYDTVKRFCAERLEMPPMPFMSWDDVEGLLRSGHEVGSHTVSHANLALASPEQLRAEISGSFEALTRKIGAPRHFAWPFGRWFHFSAAAAQAVYDAGFESCASGERGCHVEAEPRPRALCLRRDHTIARWPPGHVFHFMIANSRAAGAAENEWPAPLRVPLTGEVS